MQDIFKERSGIIMKEYVKLTDVRKVYRMGEVEIAAADGIEFTIEKGEFAVVVGPSLSLIHIYKVISLQQ